MSKKIIFLISSLRLGGQERQLYSLLQNRKKLSINPILVIWSHSPSDLNYLDRIEALNVKIIKLNKYKNPLLKIINFCYIIHKNKPKIVFSYSFFTNIIVYVSTRFFRVTPLGSIRSSYNYSIKHSGKILASLCFRYPRIQISNNYSVANKLSEISFWKPKRTYVVNNIIDEKIFQYHKIPEKNDVFRIIGIGSLIEVKRWDILLRVAKNLLSQNILFKLDIFGDGPEFDNLQGLVNKYNLHRCCSINKSRVDIYKEIIKSNILIHASDDEGCSNVILEAMSIGRPVISTNVGDASKMITNGKNGYVVDCEDVNTITNRVKELFNNKMLCNKMGVYSNKVARKNYSIEQYNISFSKVLSDSCQR